MRVFAPTRVVLLSSGFHSNQSLFCSLEPALIAKSSILLDVKPWDDETDMAKLEECVRSIQMDGLVWGQCKNTTVLYAVLCVLLHIVQPECD